VDAGRVQIVDTCVLIDLAATGHIKDILRSAARPSVICSAVSTETIYLRSDDPNNPREAIDLGPLIGSGLLSVCEIEGEAEELLYVDFAALLDDGEAMSLALAVSRGFHLATDDRKASRLFAEAIGNPERLVSTAQLIRAWAEMRSLLRNDLGRILERVQNRARYHPRVTGPDYDWWTGVLTLE
jgi:predicted nucleic acid-binding protein